MAWSFATRGVEHCPLFEAISSASLPPITAKGPPAAAEGSFNPQDIANIAWSFAQHQFEDRPLIYALSAAAIALITAFDPCQLATTSWSYAARNFADAPLLEAIASFSVHSADKRFQCAGDCESIMGLCCDPGSRRTTNGGSSGG
eukprot:CAMPEP_0180672390 /NCGR_PEP_ID=MMETSP1037_2-20121125/65106_1 /TAXON_ID=632150 /ORGANISM="Azadinium spinosum, Strain 3D9" /LENGTH=144 /DNA_ID=CAMNT_0022701529 /DNA_START=963 /DNA_END=1393 /DNA_ORIENTATION=+